MTYRDPYVLPPKLLRYVMAYYSLGDCVAELPCLTYALDNHPNLVIKLRAPLYLREFLQQALSQYGRRVILEGYDDPLTPVTDTYDARPLLNGHIVDKAFLNFLQVLPELEARSYPKVLAEPHTFDLPRDYGVLAMHSRGTLPFKAMTPEVAIAIHESFAARGLATVVLGTSKLQVSEDRWSENIPKLDVTLEGGTVVDLTDKTSVREAHSILSGARVLACVEGGIAHLAATTDVAIVAGYTYASPWNTMPYRRGTLGWHVWPVVPPETLKCRFCRCKMIGQQDCYYGDYACAKQLSPKDFKKAIGEALDH